MIHKKKRSPSKRSVSCKKENGRGNSQRKVTVVRNIPKKKAKSQNVFIRSNNTFVLPKKEVEDPNSPTMTTLNRTSQMIPALTPPQTTSSYEEEEFTDSMLDELERVEVEREMSRKPRKPSIKRHDKLVVPPPPPPPSRKKNDFVNSRPTVDAIMSYFGSRTFEASLSRYRTNVFNVSLKPERRSPHSPQHFHLRSRCWGDLQSDKYLYEQHIRFSKFKICSARCSCQRSRCCHSCISTISLWYEDHDYSSAERLHRVVTELTELKKKYSELRSKYDNDTKLLEQRISQQQQQIQELRSQQNRNRQQQNLNNMKVDIVTSRVLFNNHNERNENDSKPKKIEHKKKVTWKDPLTDIFPKTLQVKPPPPPPTNQRKKVKQENQESNGFGTMLSKSLSVLLNFNDGRAISADQKQQEKDDKSSNKRKRDGGRYDNDEMIEKLDFSKKRKLD